MILKAERLTKIIQSTEKLTIINENYKKSLTKTRLVIT